MSSLTIISLNASGLQAQNRLDHCIASLAATKPDVVMLQEHGLHAEDQTRLAKSAKRYGFLAAAAFIPSTQSKGGTAVLVKWSSFGLLPSSKLKFETALGGRVTVVSNVGEMRQSFMSVYVPASARQRLVFLERLRAIKIVSRNTIVGADRNTVSDLTTDVRYPPESRSTYQNAHAARWDKLMADNGLSDVLRLLHGPRAKSFTRLGHSVHTRIDCIFGPSLAQGIEWHSIKTKHVYNKGWRSDHLALIAKLGTSTHEPDIGKGLPRIRNEIFDDPNNIEAITQIYKEVKDYTRDYDESYKWAKQVATLTDLMRGMSADLAKKSELTRFISNSADAITATALAAGPSNAFAKSISQLQAAHKRANKQRRTVLAKERFRRVQFEEISTKEFHNNRAVTCVQKRET